MFWWYTNWPTASPRQSFRQLSQYINRLVRTLSNRESETKAGARNASSATGSWPVADESVTDDFHEEPLDVPLLPWTVAVDCGRGVGSEADSQAPLGDLRLFHGLAWMWGWAGWLDRCGATTAGWIATTGPVADCDP